MEITRINDPNIFLWMIRPMAKVFTLKPNRTGSFWTNDKSGPRFGAGADLWISPGGKARSGCASRTIKFDPEEMCGVESTGDDHLNWTAYNCEIFSITLQ